MKAKEYYKSTRMVDTMHWTLDMAMSFAEEYHKNEIEALRIHDVSGSALVEWLENQKQIAIHFKAPSGECELLFEMIEKVKELQYK